jgi:hypothetical protein
MYLDLSPLLLLGYALLAPLLIVSAGWFFVGGAADRVVDGVTDLTVAAFRIAGPAPLWRSRRAIGGRLIALGRALGGDAGALRGEAG